MSNHAILSASGAHRWLNCTPSARLELNFPDSSGESAKEGTFAHALAELKLNNFIEPQESNNRKLKAMKKNDFYSPELEEYVDEYVEMVIEKLVSSGGQLIIESRLDFSDYVPKGFGRGDAIILGDNTIEVCDLKYGRNVPVSAVDNPQLRLYGLGALSEYGAFMDAETVTMTICQPRNGGISSETLTVKELTDWGNTIRAIAETAFKGEGSTCAGEWCRFCKARVRCRALADYNLELEKFTSTDLLTDDEMAEVLERAEKLKTWVNKITEYAYDEAVNGRHWKGFKLVEGRSFRRYISESDVIKTLKEEGFKEDDFLKPRELQTITGLEKLLGKKKFSELLGDFIDKPAGKPVLVPESDKRPAIGEMFKDLGGNE